MRRYFRSTKDVSSGQRARDKKRATTALGKPLNGHPVHHHSKTQLVICEDIQYHWFLHARTEIWRAGGNPNTDDFCLGCHQPRNRKRLRDRFCHPCRKQRAIDAKKKAEDIAQAHISNLFRMGRSIRRMFRGGLSYPFDLSLAYPELAKSDKEKAKAIFARHVQS